MKLNPKTSLLGLYNKWFSRSVFENQPLCIINNYYPKKPSKLVTTNITLTMKLIIGGGSFF